MEQTQEALLNPQFFCFLASFTLNRQGTIEQSNNPEENQR